MTVTHVHEWAECQEGGPFADYGWPCAQCVTCGDFGSLDMTERGVCYACQTELPMSMLTFETGPHDRLLCPDCRYPAPEEHVGTLPLRGVCILLHTHTHDRYPISCGRPATHVAYTPKWGKAMECCEDVANDLRQRAAAGKPYGLWAWDAVDWAIRKHVPLPFWLVTYMNNGGQK